MEETQEESYARPGIIQTELVEELSRESIWKVFAMIHQKQRINEEMSPAHFARVWDLCESIFNTLSKYEDWPNLTRFIYYTQSFCSYKYASDDSCTNRYLEKPLLRKPEYMIEALCTLIEVLIGITRTTCRYATRPEPRYS